MTDRMQARALQIAALADGSISYVEKGTGTTVVFLHGIGSSARSWQAAFEVSPSDWHVMAWNAPGYPPSSPLQAEWPSASDYAERLKALLDACSMNTVHLVGHSLGCLMAARFAKLYTSRTKSLTLASCAIGHARMTEAERDRLLSSRLGDVAELGPRAMAEKRGPRLLGPKANEEQIRAVVDTMASIDPAGYAQGAHMLSKGDLIGDLETLSRDLPLQFIYGSADVITPPDVNQRAAATRPDAPVTVLQDAGHACYIEQPQAFINAVQGLVSQHA